MIVRRITTAILSCVVSAGCIARRGNQAVLVGSAHASCPPLTLMLDHGWWLTVRTDAPAVIGYGALTQYGDVEPGTLDARSVCTLIADHVRSPEMSGSTLAGAHVYTAIVGEDWREQGLGRDVYPEL